MFRQSCLLILLILANVSAGFPQSIADRARSERARRSALPESTALKDSAPLPVGHAALMEEALRVSGARRQLEQVLESSVQSLANQQQPEEISAEDYQQIINEAFDATRLMPLMEKSISTEVTDTTLTEVVRWYRSPLGSKVSTADINATGPATSAQIQRYAAMLDRNPPSQNRLRLIQDMEAATKSTDKTIQLLLSIVMSTYKGVTAAGVTISPPPPDFEQTLRAQVTEPMRQAIILSFLFAYKSLTEPELAGYLTFLKSPSAIAFNSSVWNGMHSAFGEAAQYVGRKLAQKKSSMPRAVR